jgi:hypothetical protein
LRGPPPPRFACAGGGGSSAASPFHSAGFVQSFGGFCRRSGSHSRTIG